MRHAVSILMGLAALAASGCSYNQMRLVNYADVENPEELQQAFTHASFEAATTGETTILLQTAEPMTAGENRILRQSIYVTTLWKPIPGKTYAEESQINARVIYLVEIAEQPGPTISSEKAATVLCYKGTGFVSYQLDRTGQTLTGSIERALLEPMYKGDGLRLGTFELSGPFKATRNPGAIGEFRITSRNYWR